MKEVIEETIKTPKGASEGEIVDTPRGREAMMASWREANPEGGEEVADDDLFDFAAGRYSDAEGRYNDLAGANSRLAELTSKDPKLAAVLSMIASKDGKSLPYSIAKVYGKDFLSMEDEALDDYEKAYQEELAELANDRAALEEANKNIEAYHNLVADFAKSNDISDEDADGLKGAIYDYAIGILNGIIKPEFVEFIWKGMNYDKDVQEAAEAGVVEGKNTVVKADMRRLNEASPAGGATVGSSPRIKARERRSFYDELEDVT